MMIRRGNGASGRRKGKDTSRLDTSDLRKNRCQFLRRNNFQLRIGAVARLFVGTPSAELRRVTKAAPLHVLVSDFHDQFGPQGLPR